MSLKKLLILTDMIINNHSDVVIISVLSEYNRKIVNLKLYI
jgi:hypothetical protein